MNLLRAAEFKVGLLVLAVAGLIAFMSMQVSDDPNFLGRSNEAWFLLNDAGGLVKNSAVKTAGIPVGVIKNIQLQDGSARLDLSLRPDLKLTVSASVTTKSQGILGDKYIDIYPGNITDPPLPRGGQILIVKDTGSLDNVIQKVGEIAGSLKETAQALQEAVTEEGTRKHILGRIVSNIEKVTADLAQMTGENKEKIGEIIDEVHGITANLDEILNDKSPSGLKARLSSTMKNIDEITGKINNGEGTIGKLINDEETVENLNTAIDGVNGLLDSAGKTQTAFDFHSEYLGNIGSAKTTVAVKIQPGLDRYYYLGIVDDPSGVVDVTDSETTANGVVASSSTRTTYHNKIKFTAQFAKIFYDMTVRGGLIENSGGFGLDYKFYRDKYKLTVEALEFSNINLRAQLQYNIWRGVYVNMGAQDILNKGSKFSSYLGAGFLLTNDDLKLLMTKLPM
jgi:phospholipid/cholesterol/gamma-HCH transport system substrate-binding protein